MRGAGRRRAGGDRPLFPRCRRALRPRRLVAARVVSTGSTIRRAAERLLGFRCRTDFAAILAALASGGELPFAHDPSYVSPKERPTEEAVRRGGGMLKRDLAVALGWLALTGMQAPPPRRRRRRRAGDVAARLRRVRSSPTSTPSSPTRPNIRPGRKRLVGSCYLIRHGDRYHALGHRPARRTGRPADQQSGADARRCAAASSTSSPGSACGPSRSRSSASATIISIIPARRRTSRMRG